MPSGKKSTWHYWIGVTLLLAAAGMMRPAAACSETLDFSKRPLNGGEPVRLCDAYQGKVLLVVNTASKCGYTPQYEALERLYDERKGDGLVVIGFPSNDFGGQEPGTEAQIQQFCRLTYGVQFPMFEKTHAARGKADPFYERLATRAGEYPRWNFHKYLIDRNGNLAGSFPSHVDPYDPQLQERIEELL
jgi:glutathione peroxidase